ncbi:MAG TPA: hypothetical protein VGS03_09565 [Candidatus Polarisedimenticolia bacterium]|jgi:hypothetical protein|nr:hypothetical protein [Candidatus Polarisedimenticolia bacterium]
MTGRRAVVVLLGLLACGPTACTDLELNPLPTVGSSPGDQAVAQPSLRTDVQPIFTARCAIAGCHIIATEANYGLVLTDAVTSHDNLVNVPSGKYPPFLRVLPGNSSASVLAAMIDDQEMPKAGPPLSQGTIDTIKNWIDQGAQDN